MSRESDNGHVCGDCGETVYHDYCACEPQDEQDRRVSGPTFAEAQTRLARALDRFSESMKPHLEESWNRQEQQL